MTRLKRTGILILLLLIGALVLGFPQVRAALNAGLSRWFARQEVRFDVPERPFALDANVVISQDHIRICNRSASPWNGVTLRAISRVSMGGLPSELPLLGQVSRVNAGVCFDVPNSDLFSPGWKRIPAPAVVNIVRVEILTSVTGPGYFVKDESSGAVSNQ